MVLATNSPTSHVKRIHPANSPRRIDCNCTVSSQHVGYMNVAVFNCRIQRSLSRPAMADTINVRTVSDKHFRRPSISGRVAAATRRPTHCSCVQCSVSNDGILINVGSRFQQQFDRRCTTGICTPRERREPPMTG